MNLDQAILQHLHDRSIDDQAELLALLRADGFDLTLSTLSRHLKKLQVRKDQGRYQPIRPFKRSAAPAFTLRKVSPCLLVLKTSPGFAQAMAFALDEAGLPSLAGTIAGDDTIFAAPVDPDRLDALELEVRTRLQQGF